MHLSDLCVEAKLGVKDHTQVVGGMLNAGGQVPKILLKATGHVWGGRMIGSKIWIH